MSDQWQAAILGGFGGMALAFLVIVAVEAWERCRGITYGVHVSQLPEGWGSTFSGPLCDGDMTFYGWWRFFIVSDRRFA